MSSATDMPLVGGTEIAQMLGLTRGGVHQLVHRKGFPDPAYYLQMGRIWRTADVIDWAERHGRTCKPPESPQWKYD